MRFKSGAFLLSRPGAPAHGVKPPHARQADIDALDAQQLAFQLEVAPITAERTGSADDAMARSCGVVAVAHDVADCAPGTRPSGERGDIPIGCDSARRNPPDRHQHATTEVSHRPMMTLRRYVAPPRFDSPNLLETPFAF